MRIPCPLCGPRDRREFYYYGTTDYLDRTSDQGTLDDLDNHLFLRDNPAGQTRDLWYHENGCTSWLIVTRNTVTHAILGAELVMDREAALTPAPIPAAKPAAKPARKATPKKDASNA